MPERSVCDTRSRREECTRTDANKEGGARAKNKREQYQSRLTAQHEESKDMWAGPHACLYSAAAGKQHRQAACNFANTRKTKMHGATLSVVAEHWQKPLHTAVGQAGLPAAAAGVPTQGSIQPRQTRWCLVCANPLEGCCHTCSKTKCTQSKAAASRLASLIKEAGSKTRQDAGSLHRCLVATPGKQARQQTDSGNVLQSVCCHRGCLCADRYEGCAQCTSATEHPSSKPGCTHQQ